MYLTAHALAGALIGETTGNIFISFILGFISHFILDAIPHQETGSGEGFFDGLFGREKFSKSSKIFGLILFLDLTVLSLSAYFLYSLGAFNNLTPAIAGALGGIMPDFLNGLYFTTKNKCLGYFSNLHHQIHFKHEKIKVSNIAGIASQVIIVILAISLLVK